jgi:hypothetical protein
MATTVEELERRLAQVEREVIRLRQQVEGVLPAETPSDRGARLLDEARMSQPAISTAAAKAFAEMGITGEPVGPEKLREMMAACGVNPGESVQPRDRSHARGMTA